MVDLLGLLPEPAFVGLVGELVEAAVLTAQEDASQRRALKRTKISELKSVVEARLTSNDQQFKSQKQQDFFDSRLLFAKKCNVRANFGASMLQQGHEIILKSK